MSRLEEKVFFFWIVSLGIFSWVIITIVGTIMIRLMR